MRIHLVVCTILTLAAPAWCHVLAEEPAALPGRTPEEQAPQDKQDVRVTDFGAVADGRTDCLVPIQRAIDAVSADGGVMRDFRCRLKSVRSNGIMPTGKLVCSQSIHRNWNTCETAVFDRCHYFSR